MAVDIVNTAHCRTNKGGRKGLIDLAGRTFSKLSVERRATLSEVAEHTGCGKGANLTSARWFCRCSCGQEKLVLGSNLLNGSTKSCGTAGCKIGRKRTPHEFNERPRASRGLRRQEQEAAWRDLNQHREVWS